MRTRILLLAFLAAGCSARQVLPPQVQGAMVLAKEIMTQEARAATDLLCEMKPDGETRTRLRRELTTDKGNALQLRCRDEVGW
jgi:hypothetical protein